MGSTSYNLTSRTLRANAADYATASVDSIFTQNQVKRIHESMEPAKAQLREARDSEVHKKTVPIVLGLDVTGSMGHIPHDLIKEGLPKLMSKIIQNATPDPALLFLGIGDTEYDKHPLQVGQFESGDLELDTWLTRTYIEGGGGGNAGESYLLAWYYAAQHTATDSWEKRGEKGFLITVGDEPGLPSLPKDMINKLMGLSAQASLTDASLLQAAQEKWEVFHINLKHGGRDASPYWNQLLGDHCISLTDYKEVPTAIANIVQEQLKLRGKVVVQPTTKTEVKTDKEEPLL